MSSLALTILLISSASCACCCSIHCSRELSSSFRMAAEAVSILPLTRSLRWAISPLVSLPSTCALMVSTSWLRVANWSRRWRKAVEKMSPLSSGWSLLSSLGAGRAALAGFSAFSICFPFFPFAISNYYKYLSNLSRFPSPPPLPRSLPLFQDGSGGSYWLIMEGSRLSPLLTVLSLVNGMIGGLILILPVLALSAGYLTAGGVILVTGFFSYFSSRLCVAHVGGSGDLDEALQRHFGSVWLRRFYDLCVWSNLLLIGMLYFELVVLQWVGLAPPHHYTLLNPLANAALLLGLVLLAKFRGVGASLMAYGVVSIASYLLFLGWVLASQPAGGARVEFRAVGSGAVQMAAAMGQAFSIQSFFIPILKETNQPERAGRYVLLAYLIGGAAYLFIAFAGAMGIRGRECLGYSESQITIEDYFGVGAWEVNVVEAIYLAHLYSVFPQFLLISKKRLFGVLGLAQTEKGRMNMLQLGYFTAAVGICLLVCVLQVSMRDIIDVNGAVIGFFFIYAIPACLHLKCVYFSKGEVKEGDEKYQEMVEEGESAKESKNKQEKEEKKGENKEEKMENKLESKSVISVCGIQPQPKWKQRLDLLLVLVMLGLGSFILIDGIVQLAQ